MASFPYTEAELKAQLADVDAAIAKVRESQKYSTGPMTLERGPYYALLRERRWLINQIMTIAAQDAGGFSNRAKFQRPS